MVPHHAATMKPMVTQSPLLQVLCTMSYTVRPYARLVCVLETRLQVVYLNTTPLIVGFASSPFPPQVLGAASLKDHSPHRNERGCCEVEIPDENLRQDEEEVASCCSVTCWTRVALSKLLASNDLPTSRAIYSVHTHEAPREGLAHDQGGEQETIREHVIDDFPWILSSCQK